jgi:type II secretory pathway pseudopilin PulG
MEKKGFTLIEVLIIVGIIIILVTISLTIMGNTKKNARLNNVKTVLKTAILTVYSCNDAGSVVNLPNNPENGTHAICSAAAGSFWPVLPNGYSYNAGGNFSSSCSFSINTNGDSASDLICDCSTQLCS